MLTLLVNSKGIKTKYTKIGGVGGYIGNSRAKIGNSCAKIDFWCWPLAAKIVLDPFNLGDKIDPFQNK